MLRYAERVRALTAAELAQEIAALGDPGNQPMRQLQLAIALMHSSQAVETARALGLAQRAAANGAPEAAAYRPLARLIANRLLEQRKLEETVERQAQQLREQQRRIEQLNERLEAMRAIERSLNNRAPATAPRPAAP
jgi:DNA repair ATPase RecN